jgi:hypothetical protein
MVEMVVTLSLILLLQSVVVVVVLHFIQETRVDVAVVAGIVQAVAQVRQAKAMQEETMQQAVAQVVVALGRRVYQWEVAALEIL